jgi:hypothetical protein
MILSHADFLRCISTAPGNAILVWNLSKQLFIVYPGRFISPITRLQISASFNMIGWGNYEVKESRNSHSPRVELICYQTYINLKGMLFYIVYIYHISPHFGQQLTEQNWGRGRKFEYIGNNEVNAKLSASLHLPLWKQQKLCGVSS